MLLGHPGEVVLREEIRRKLWPNNTIVEFDHSINAAIKRLRNALGESADDPRHIETLARRGYRFVGEVERVGEPLAELLEIGAGDDLSGRAISRYRVMEKLGSGGMGEVWKTRDLRHRWRFRAQPGMETESRRLVRRYLRRRFLLRRSRRSGYDVRSSR